MLRILLNNPLNMVIIMCRDSDTPIEIVRFSYNPEYVENEVIYTLISLKTDFQLLFDNNFRIKTFSEALDEYRKNIGVKKRDCRLIRSTGGKVQRHV